MQGGESMNEEFISEPIEPVAGTFDPAGMTRTEPGLPGRFVWRKTEYTVADVIRAWKETGPCKSGSGEQYLRKHWYKIRATSGEVMKIYFERKPMSKGQRKIRWWLYSISKE